MTKIPRLFEIMEKRNITAKDLTRATGISAGNISDWKNGRSSPSAKKLRVLSEYLDVSIDYLLFQENDNPIINEKRSPREERIVKLIDNDDNLKRLAELLSLLSDDDLTEVERYVDYLVNRQEKKQD